MPYEAKRRKWHAEYEDDVVASFVNHLADLDPLPIAAIVARITAPLVHKAARSAPLAAVNVERRLHNVMDFAVQQGYIERNPLPPRSPTTRTKKNLAAITDRVAVGELLRHADVYECSRGVRRAHEMCVYTCQRISEVVGATWNEIDLQTATWTIKRDRMKVRGSSRPDHAVPVPKRLLARLKEWKRETGDTCAYVCPARDGVRALTVEAVEKHYRRGLQLSGKHSPHSWRTVLSTWTGDSGRDTDLSELQLDHLIGSSIKQSYDRSQRLELRRELMQWHEDALTAARDGAAVLPITGKHGR